MGASGIAAGGPRSDQPRARGEGGRYRKRRRGKNLSCPDGAMRRSLVNLDGVLVVHVAEVDDLDPPSAGAVRQHPHRAVVAVVGV